ncbi:MAG: hypothetical protein MI866_04295 [Bacteroidales bacterium]|nr:hypothetical protein [Bacteroidales bacterium]
MKTIKILSIALLALVIITACDDDDNVNVNGNLSLTINGLEDLGANYIYEGWIIVDGQALTTGTFSVDGSGKLSQSSFSIDREDLQNSSAFVLTIEPFPDTDPAPSNVHILAGDIAGGKASLTVDHGAALGTDFSTAMGKYILATPTDGMDNNENSGVWFLDPSSGSPAAGLDLPVLPEGWIYEGWAVIDGQAVTTGKFSSVNAADNASPFSGTQAGPPFPGEDFLMSAPNGLTFPTDLSGGKAVISIEPVPDNSDAPFLLKPLLGDIPQNAAHHTVYSLGNIAADTNPVGNVNITIE